MTTPTFQQFWDAYALKRDRFAAEKTWKRLTHADRRLAIAGIDAYRSDCEQRGISRMYAQGYLSHRRWEDEPSGHTQSTHTTHRSTAPTPTLQPVEVHIPAYPDKPNMETW